MSSIKTDWAWADLHLTAISEILRDNARHLLTIKKANLHEDRHDSTDLKLVVGSDVAIRVRRPTRYRDFTLRAHRPKGTKTEFEKIKDGAGDFYLYCWTDSANDIVDWVLVDLHRLRSSPTLRKERSTIPNQDGTVFIAISLRELAESNCITAASNRQRRGRNMSGTSRDVSGRSRTVARARQAGGREKQAR